MEQPQLIITMLENGAINVTGPIGNKTLCYGMLESAKDAIRDYIAKNQAVIVPVKEMPVALNGKPI